MTHPLADTGEPVDLARARRILVARLDNLGDVVMTTPVLRALRVAAPTADIGLLTSPAGAAAAPMLPVRWVLPLSASWQRAGGAVDVRPELALLPRLAAYDVLLVLTSARQSPWVPAYLGLLAGIGVRAVHSREFAGAAATHWVTPPPDDLHQVDRGLHLLAALGVPDAGTHLELDVPPEAVDAARAMVDGRYALLVPGASCASKRYDAGRFARAARLVAEEGLAVLVTGSDGEAELVARVVEAAEHPGVRALPPVGVPVFAGLVVGADVVLANNSAAVHVADATGTPVVVTHAGTERPTDMPPRAVPHSVLTRPVPCAPCRRFRCPYGRECLDIAPDVVAGAVLGAAA